MKLLSRSSSALWLYFNGDLLAFLSRLTLSPSVSEMIQIVCLWTGCLFCRFIFLHFDVSDKTQQLRVKVFMFSACEPKLRSLRLQMSSVPSFSSSFPLFTAGLSREWKRSVIGNCEISLIQRTGGLQLRITRTLKSTLHDLRFLKGGISSNVWNRFENGWVFC